jgi:hypothetical protein
MAQLYTTNKYLSQTHHHHHLIFIDSDNEPLKDEAKVLLFPGRFYSSFLFIVIQF